MISLLTSQTARFGVPGYSRSKTDIISMESFRPRRQVHQTSKSEATKRQRVSFLMVCAQIDSNTYFSTVKRSAIPTPLTSLPLYTNARSPESYQTSILHPTISSPSISSPIRSPKKSTTFSTTISSMFTMKAHRRFPAPASSASFAPRHSSEEQNLPARNLEVITTAIASTDVSSQWLFWTCSPTL